MVLTGTKERLETHSQGGKIIIENEDGRMSDASFLIKSKKVKITYMHVMPAHRGKGLQRKMIKLIEDESGSYALIEAFVEISNQHSMTNFEKCGYQLDSVKSGICKFKKPIY